MDVYTLKKEYYRHNPNGHFFDTDTLHFFGERLSEMRVLQKLISYEDETGKTRKCYVLSSYQHKAPVPGRAYHYFDVETFDLVPH